MNTQAAPIAPAPGAAYPPARAPGEAWGVWDRVGVALAWIAGVGLCVIAAAILIYMLYRGLQFLKPAMLVTHPQPGLGQKGTGGFLDPLIGTFALTIIGIVIATPIGVGIAVWLSEYGRPSWLARSVESGVEIVAGTPSIVLAIFGLLVFSQSFFSFLSFTAAGDAVFGRSYLIAGAMMSLIALPLVVGSTREALQAIPSHVREASYALGKDRASTIRRVLLPGARPGIATGATLGMGRIAGDTAIAFILLGGTLTNQGVGSVPLLNFLKGTGSTLTTYVFGNSPAGEGGAPDKAYAAAFVLLVAIVLLNFGVDLIAKRGSRWQNK